MKLHLGCGNVIKPGYTNVDISPLPGVDVVANLAEFPWPFADGAAEVVELHNILEHLPDTFKTLEEIHRICSPGARVLITVPYYNSIDFGSDPTHLHAFSQRSMDFLDPRTPAGKEREYYSKARFHITNITYFTTLALGKWIGVKNTLGRKVLGGLAFFLCNIIRAMTFELKAIK